MKFLRGVLNLVLVNFYGFVNLRVIFNNTCRIKSFFPYKDRINRSQRSKVVYRANCWDCDSFYVGKTKRRLHDGKTEHFKALSQGCHASALADHVISTGHNIKWDHFDILTTGKSDVQCKIKETLLISELKPLAMYRVRESKSKLKLLYRMSIIFFLPYCFGPRLEYMFERSLKLPLHEPKRFNAFPVLKWFLLLLEVTCVIFARATNTDVWQAIVACY